MSRAKFTESNRIKIFERDDWTCLICRTYNPYQVKGYGQALEAHHAWFGGEAQRDPGRNFPERGVTLCHECHHAMHNYPDQVENRELCKEYLLAYYNEIKKKGLE